MVRVLDSSGKSDVDESRVLGLVFRVRVRGADE